MYTQKSIITFDEFSKSDLCIGRVLECKDVTGSEKLFMLHVDFGQQIGIRTIYAGLRPWYKKSQLMGKKFVFVVNLPPRKMPGGESNGMMLVIENGDNYLLLPAPKNSVEGARLC